MQVNSYSISFFFKCFILIVVFILILRFHDLISLIISFSFNFDVI